MTTPPRPSPDEVAAAMARIAERRRRIGDEHEELAYGEPWEVLDFLRRHSGRDVPSGVRADDVADGLILRFHLWWEGEEMEAWLLDSAAKAGIALPAVAVMLGLGTGPAVAQRRHRLSEKLAGRPPLRKYHPAAADTIPNSRPPAEARPDEPEDVRQRWLARHRQNLERYAAVLIDHKDLPGLSDDTYKAVLDLRQLSRDPGRGIAWIAELSYATVALVSDSAVQALPAEHQLRRTLARLDDLTDQWAALGRKRPRATDEDLQVDLAGHRS